MVSPPPDTARGEPEATQSDLSSDLTGIDAPKSTWDHLKVILQNARLAQKQAADVMASKASEKNKQGIKMLSQTQTCHVQECPSRSRDSTPAKNGSKTRKTNPTKNRSGPAKKSSAKKAPNKPKNNTKENGQSGPAGPPPAKKASEQPKKRSLNLTATNKANHTPEQSNHNQEEPPLGPDKSDSSKHTPKARKSNSKKRPLNPEESVMTEETPKKLLKLNKSERSTGKTLKVIPSPLPSPTRVQKAQEKMREQQRREMDMYAPDIDPSAKSEDDVPLPTPFALAKKMYESISPSYIENKLGKVFPKVGVSPSKKLKVAWPEDAPHDTNKMKSWLEKEEKWAKSGLLAKYRPRWSFQPAPKNFKGVEAWLHRHNEPLQRQDYVSEYSKISKTVSKLRQNFETFPGALRIDEQNPERFMENLRKFAAADDGDDDCDSQGESYDERMRRIKSRPANDTIEYDDRIDSDHAASIKEATDAMKRGDVSGASVPSERFHFNEGSNRVLSRGRSKPDVEEIDETEMAASILMELSEVSRMAVHHPLSDDTLSGTDPTLSSI